DRLELTANLRRGVGLHVPHVDLRGPATKPDDDARLRARPYVALRGSLSARRGGQTQPQKPDSRSPPPGATRNWAAKCGRHSREYVEHRSTSSTGARSDLLTTAEYARRRKDSPTKVE